MPSVFKYTPAKYVDGFVRRGEVLFRSLSYYRDYEEQHVRGDKHEGTRTHSKPNGLVMTNVESAEDVTFNGAYEAQAKAEDIFVLCLSTELSARFGSDFDTTTCIKIHNPAPFLAGIRSALNRRPAIKNQALHARPVTYYDAGDNVGIEWAFPDRIAMSKTRHYEQQKEFCIAFGINGALAFQNTSIRLTTAHHIDTRLYHHPQMLLKLGDLRRYCTVWEFDANGVPVSPPK